MRVDVILRRVAGLAVLLGILLGVALVAVPASAQSGDTLYKPRLDRHRLRG